eukprot:16381-Heterococcus_DN1.PRE.1
MEEPQLKGRQVIDVVLPTYVMKPNEKEVFYPNKVKAMAEQVRDDRRLHEHQQFRGYVVKEELAGKKFDEQEAKEWSLNIADTIRERVRQLNIPRYKVIVQVTIGQMLDQGVRVASRCLWDTATDNYA